MKACLAVCPDCSLRAVRSNPERKLGKDRQGQIKGFNGRIDGNELKVYQTWYQWTLQLIVLKVKLFFPKGQNDRVLKTLIQIVNTTWNIQSAHLTKTSSTDMFQHGQWSRDDVNTSLDICWRLDEITNHEQYLKGTSIPWLPWLKPLKKFRC